ncbi:MAG: saccharopine dehydrogenase NADP-binding domain-containing protein [Proteobacteria bacterium]|nr:saccharopine dehydrogenase NADP-binding domain-containing protein [Pseudomonadota bacterium]
MTGEHEFEIVVYGASGFTGRLVAEYLQRAYGSNVAWAMAGRDRAKLEAVRSEIGAGAPIIVAAASDPASLEALARRTKVVLTTVGPYQLHGEPLLAACVDAGADYVDLCGEPNWMAAMIAKYEARAKASGARITFSCGFDSIPFDLGVFYLQQQASERFGAPLMVVHGRVRKMKGGFSGGTMASMLATMKAVQADPSLAKVLTDPFALAGAKGAPQPRGDAARHDEGVGWAAPFVMAPINTKNVHRSNALMNYAYGRDFIYDEMMLTGEGANGEKRARAAVNQSKMQTALLGFAPTRALLRAFVLPKPGQGPSKQERENGSYDVLFAGATADGRTLRAGVKGDKDPGYGSTSKMIAEAALCLARDVDHQATAGGIWTPAAAMGGPLIERLRAHAGLTFQLEN